MKLLTFLDADGRTKSDVHKLLGTRKAMGAIRDAAALDLVDHDGERYTLGRTARSLVNGGQITEKNVAGLCLGKPNIKKVLDAASDGPLGYNQQKAILQLFGSTSWSDLTWKWRLGVLSTWLTKSGHAKATRTGLTAVSHPGEA